MIHWLLQSTDAHPDLARGHPPVGLLCKLEHARLSNLTIDKRRREWLLGRWTAKQLLQAYLEQETGARRDQCALSQAFEKLATAARVAHRVRSAIVSANITTGGHGAPRTADRGS